jgi:hypothetical protein
VLIESELYKMVASNDEKVKMKPIPKLIKVEFDSFGFESFDSNIERKKKTELI